MNSSAKAVESYDKQICCCSVSNTPTHIYAHTLTSHGFAFFAVTVKQIKSLGVFPHKHKVQSKE